MEEKKRLAEDRTREKNWKRWGPYLSERQWGTVREDYSEHGECWDYFPHDHARSRAYRWGEDGLMGLTDRQCRLCFCVGLWNEKDAILKERLFGLTGPEGNHGEDVKELYYYLDSTPTHSYMKTLYKYPQAEYPYSQLVGENQRRGVEEPEFELEDSGVFNDNRYWDVFTEYAKVDANDVLAKITVHNRGPEEATIHVLPQLWYRNTWIWGCTHEGCTMKPKMKKAGPNKVECSHDTLGGYGIEFCNHPDSGEEGKILFTENETHSQKLFGVDNYTDYVRDAFHRYVVNSETAAVNPKERGTKVAGHYVLRVPAGESRSVTTRFYDNKEGKDKPLDAGQMEAVFAERKAEADNFYGEVIQNTDPESYNVARQAYAGLLFTKQFYHYVVKDWLQGDPDMPPPPEQRKHGRNNDWKHLFNRDVISMPDKWEYPWYASWDLAFHMMPFADIDIDFAKEQLLLFLREWYMHPNGQIPAYEFAFGDVNPPVHCIAVMHVWRRTGPKGERDMEFLARCFQKLVLNFTWWVNRKDPSGRNIFAGGFLGLDNIGVFDRSQPLPTGGHLEQADGTAWMATFAAIMLEMALELAMHDHIYEDMASKFFEHFIAISDAMNKQGGEGLWSDNDGFFYDHLNLGGNSMPLPLRSMVGLVPLFACLCIDEQKMEKLPGFYKRCKWFIKNRPDLASQISFMTEGMGMTRALLAIPTEDQLRRVLKYVLDENEFLSPFGVRSMSKHHMHHPFEMDMGGQHYCVKYVPGESNTFMFGGNSNWRGPIWLCMHMMVQESLKRYHFYYGDGWKVECPTGSGNMMNLKEVAEELSRRSTQLFLPNENGFRPCHGNSEKYAKDPHWKDLILFYEFFHGCNGRGCGASHQTGWTAVVASYLHKGPKMDF